MLKPSITRDSGTPHGHENRRYPAPVAALAKFLASGGMVGYVPVAQGTVASLWIPLVYLLLPASWFVERAGMVSLALAGLTLILYGIGVWVSEICESFWGPDPGRIVIDEVAGMCCTLLFLPLTGVTVWGGFFLFRLFDILKPPPARLLERRGGGWGVMNDDVVAGVYANIGVRLLLFVLR